MTLSADLKEKLGKRQDDIARAMANAVKVDGENVTVPTEAASDIRGWLEETKSIQAVLQIDNMSDETKALLEVPEVEFKSILEQARGSNGPFPNLAAGGFVQAKSIGEMFMASEEFQEYKTERGNSMRSPFTLESFEQKDIYRTSGGILQGPGFGSVDYLPIVPRSFRTMRVRDLFPVVNTSANLIDFFRVLGFGSNRLDLTSAASVVPDRTTAAGGIPATGISTDIFGLKPHSNLKFEPANAPVRTLAHWEVAHRNLLDDEPAMRGIIDNELLYGLRLQEDYQILNGTGTGEDILGIYNTPGIQTYGRTTGSGPYTPQVSPPHTTDTYPDTLRRAATLVMLAYYEGTGFVINPLDWEITELTKGVIPAGGAGDGQYVVTTNIAVGAEQRIWRQPVVATPATPAGTFLTGAFGLGATLFDRQIANIRISESHSDLFTKNAITILGESRLALACTRPEAFVRGSF